MKVLAETDGDVFQPNPEPLGPVDYLFVCMEPSLGSWARSANEAKSKVESGFLNFLSSFEDFILHFCIRQYLCAPRQRYHLTDLSKGAMLVKHASVSRTERYERWYRLFMEGVDLVVKPLAGIFAVGNAVARHIQRNAFPRPFTKVIHYSGLAARDRAAGILGHEDRFAEFQNSVSLRHVLAAAEDVLMASGVPTSLREETQARLMKSRLSTTRQHLIFNYKLAFEPMRSFGCDGTDACH